jgi:adenosine 3'-phospho 5'-phosphosulfate transporter B2
MATKLKAFSTHLPALQVKNLDARLSAPLHAYAAVSASNVMATTCQYEALKFLSFPVQTLGKSAKMIPVMLWGALILRKRYRPREYALAVVMTLGCALFLASGEVTCSPTYCWEKNVA